MGEAMEVNGVSVDREQIRAWLKAKRVALWSDWLIGDSGEEDLAIDWILNQMGNLSSFAKPNDGPQPVKHQLDLSPRVLTPA